MRWKIAAQKSEAKGPNDIITTQPKGPRIRQYSAVPLVTSEGLFAQSREGQPSHRTTVSAGTSCNNLVYFWYAPVTFPMTCCYLATADEDSGKVLTQPEGGAAMAVRTKPAPTEALWSSGTYRLT